ncbi:hypothetical protein OIA45_48940 (plasmid) [Streptomyces chartreusis]|uniref:hypothetical protein n=1 Tax=Streptomyces chartreusis TaxID=1969 RepID=UPI0037DC70A0|nr:hypothetical protein OIA45_48940 [Streptomyces chartreusis]
MSAHTVPAGVGPDDPGAGVARADEALAARNAAAAEHLAGIIADAQLDTAGSPRKLPMDLFPDFPPEMVQAVWERALVVGVRAGQLMQAPRFYRDKLHRLQGELTQAGYVAMGRAARKPLSAAQRYPDLHAIDDEEARGH